MSPQQKVKQVHPLARSERYPGRGFSAGHNLIWSRFGHDAKRLGEGKTAAAAWKDAANNLPPKALPVPEPQLAASGSVPPPSTVCPKDSLTDERPYTYASTQATNCAQCGEYKHTPLRIDGMDGYVCLTCIDKRLEGFFDAEQQRAAVGAGAAELPEPVYWQWRRKSNPWNPDQIYGHEVHATTDDSEVRQLFAAPLGAVAVDAAPQQNPDSVHQVGATPQAAAALGQTKHERAYESLLAVAAYLGIDADEEGTIIAAIERLMRAAAGRGTK